MPSLQVRGQEQLGRLARVLTEKGNGKALTSRMRSSFRKSAKDITQAQRESLAAGLPKRGGADATITGESRFSINTSLGGATVTITDRWPGHSMKAIDKGTLRHPLFGNRHHWYDTSITPLLLTRPFLDRKVAVQLELFKTMEALAEEIAREV